MRDRSANRLQIVGAGVSGTRQLTIEGVLAIEEAYRVITLSASADDIEKMNRNILRLDRLYWSRRADWGTYRALAKTVVEEARRVGGKVAFVVDGNPAIFDDITWETYRLARRYGLEVSIVPGISTIDVLPIRLHFDPGNAGLQVVEANQLVVYRLQLNPEMSTLILQVGWFGTAVLRRRQHSSGSRLRLLTRHLLNFYAGTHPAVFLFAHRLHDDVIETTVADLPRVARDVHPGMTLFLPRLPIRVRDKAFFRSLYKEGGSRCR